MRLPDALLGEHGVLRALFDHVEKTVSADSDISTVHTACAVVETLLVSHASLEEELLFKDMEAVIGAGGPLSVMRAEHAEIDRLLESARGSQDVAAAGTALHQALELARAHFQKEEAVLFVMARQVLDDDSLIRSGEDWARSRNVTLG